MVQQAHRKMVEASVKTMASVLQEVLSRRVTAFIVGVKDGKTVSRWASGEVTEIRDPEVEQRLRSAFAIVQLILMVSSPNTIRAWFIGMNPQLGDLTPAEAIREGDAAEAMNAACAFVTNG